MLSAILIILNIFTLFTSADTSLAVTLIITGGLDRFFYPVADDAGYASVKSLVSEIKNDCGTSFVIDTGDLIGFTSSSLPSLLGHDIVSLGNRDLENGFDSYSDSMKNAFSSSYLLPSFICTNVEVSLDPADSSINDYGFKKYKVIRSDNICVAFLSVMDESSFGMILDDSFFKFTDPSKAVSGAIREIEALYSPDIYICVYHSDNNDTELSEEKRLIRSVDNLDLVITTSADLPSPVKVGGAFIVSSSFDGSSVIRADVQVENAVFSVANYRSVSFNRVDSTPDIYGYYSHYGYEYIDSVLASFSKSKYNADHTKYCIIDSLLSLKHVDSIPTVALLSECNYSKVPLSGDFTVRTAFRSYPFGTGADGNAGYSVCEFYVTGNELYALCEAGLPDNSLGTEFCYSFGGLKYYSNSLRAYLNRVYNVVLSDGSQVSDDNVYRVITDSYTLKKIFSINDKTFGFLDIKPKTSDMKVSYNIKNFVDKNEDGIELKVWSAFADYISDLDTGLDNFADVPDSALDHSSCANVDNTPTFTGLFSRWTLISWLYFSAIMTVVIIIFFGVLLTVKHVKKKRRIKAGIIEEFKNEYDNPVNGNEDE